MQKKHLEKGNRVGVILMDLCEGFDMINHSLLLAKLEVYDFSTNFLKIMQNYMCNRLQKSKVNGSFSDWTEILEGVP